MTRHAPPAGSPEQTVFGPFVLDTAAARLLRDGHEVPLRPRAFELLCVLAARAGRLVTKDELLDAVWGTRFVTEGVIKTTVGELRDALGDDPKHPRWIETVPRRGYRFASPPAAARAIPDAPAAELAVGAAPGTVAKSAALVGRDDGLVTLARAWQAVLRGERRVVFVSGDAGIGKTALAGAFVERLREGIAAHGQCVEAFGRGEPYLPWLEALATLAPAVDDLPSLMRRVAPCWLAQLPWLQSEADRAVTSAPTDAQRMPREIATLLEQIAQRQPLLIVLEDLHWSDPSSVQLLDFLARRRVPARMLVLATFRATDLLLAEHPMADVRRELRLHRLAEEIVLDGLDAPALKRLLGAWSPGANWSAEALAALHAHTEGVPLFARAVIDTLASEGVLRSDNAGCWHLAGTLPQPLPLPDSIAGLFEKQLAALTSAQRELLEAAAVAGVEFDAAVVAATLGRDLADVHERCDGLVRGGRWLQAAGMASRANGPPSGRYRFGHALMQGLCYARCGGARRAELHRGVAEALLDNHGTHCDELAAELAYHYDQALDADAALPWLRKAIDHAWNRLASRERLAHSERALALLPRCTSAIAEETRRRWAFELAHARASAISHLEGYWSPMVGEAARAAVVASEGQPVDEDLLNVHRLLWLNLVVGGRFDEAFERAEATVSSVVGAAIVGCEVQALSMLHFSAFKCGAFDRARQAIVRADALAPQVVADDPGYVRFFARQAQERLLIRAMLDTLQERPDGVDPAALRRYIADPNGPTVGRVLNGVLCGLWHAWRGDAATVEHDARDMLALIEQEGLTSGAAVHRVLLHWAEGVRGDAAAASPRLCSALDEVLGSAHVADRAALLELAADLALRAARPAQAAAHLDAAFEHVRATGERYLLARLWWRRVQVAEAAGSAEGAARARKGEAQARSASIAGDLSAALV